MAAEIYSINAHVPSEGGCHKPISQEILSSTRQLPEKSSSNIPHAALNEDHRTKSLEQQIIPVEKLPRSPESDISKGLCNL